MPLYEYQCETCANRFERIQKFADPPIAECPVCAGPVRKLPSSPAIQFKGSGWYITDYARKSGPGASDSKSGESGESGESGAKSGDGSTGSSPSESTAGASTSSGDGASVSPAASKTTTSSETTSKPSTKSSTDAS